MNVFKNIELRLKDIEKLMDLSKKELDLLLSHKRIKKAKLKVNGKKYEAWRILHNNALGPGKGGIRYHPGVSEDEVKSLSFWMSLKNSLMGLPYGGAKGGVKLDPGKLTKKELEELSRKYIKSVTDKGVLIVDPTNDECLIKFYGGKVTGYNNPVFSELTVENKPEKIANLVFKKWIKAITSNPTAKLPRTFPYKMLYSVIN